MELSCDQLEELLPEMMDGKMAPPDEEAAATHLATCESCRLIVDETQQIRRVAHELGRAVLPDASRDRIRAFLESEADDGPVDR